MEKEKQVLFTAEDVKELIATAVTAAVVEAKKPAPLSDAELVQIEYAQASRAEQAQSVKEEMANKRWQQSVCTHKHQTGESHCVFIQDGNYILCQKCQAKVRPGVAPQGYKGTDFFDTNKFNQLFQEIVQADVQ